MSYKFFVSPSTLKQTDKVQLMRWATEHHMPSEPGVAFERWLDALQGVDKETKAKALALSRGWTSSPAAALPHDLVAAEARWGLLGLFALAAAAILAVGRVAGEAVQQVVDTDDWMNRLVEEQLREEAGNSEEGGAAGATDGATDGGSAKLTVFEQRSLNEAHKFFDGLSTGPLKMVNFVVANIEKFQPGIQQTFDQNLVDFADKNIFEVLLEKTMVVAKKFSQSVADMKVRAQVHQQEWIQDKALELEHLCVMKALRYDRHFATALNGENFDGASELGKKRLQQYIPRFRGTVKDSKIAKELNSYFVSTFTMFKNNKDTLQRYLFPGKGLGFDGDAWAGAMEEQATKAWLNVDESTTQQEIQGGLEDWLTFKILVNAKAIAKKFAKYDESKQEFFIEKLQAALDDVVQNGPILNYIITESNTKLNNIPCEPGSVFCSARNHFFGKETKQKLGEDIFRRIQQYCPHLYDLHQRLKVNRLHKGVQGIIEEAQESDNMLKQFERLIQLLAATVTGAVIGIFMGVGGTVLALTAMYYRKDLGMCCKCRSQADIDVTAGGEIPNPKGVFYTKTSPNGLRYWAQKVDDSGILRKCKDKGYRWAQVRQYILPEDAGYHDWIQTDRPLT